MSRLPDGNKINLDIDEEIFEKAKEGDLSLDEAEELHNLVNETGFDVDEAEELRQGL